MPAAIRWSLLLSMSLLAACGDKGSAPPPATESTSQSEASAPTATGNVVEIKAITDEKGNRFEPSEVEVRPGDVLRVVLVSGVHNISFPAESNPGAAGLPAPSDMLQLPGQTLDVPIAFAPGEYVFQCDPHAALGMVGKLEVEDD
jgi:plastocyanin